MRALTGSDIGILLPLARGVLVLYDCKNEDAPGVTNPALKNLGLISG